MSNRVAVRPEQLRELAQEMRSANERNLESITNRITTRKTVNENLSGDKSTRETTLYDNMFVQVDNAGLSELITSFNESYNQRSTNKAILNRAIGHSIPSSMTDVFLTHLSPSSTRNDTRWFVGGSRWGGLNGATGTLRRHYNAVVNTLQAVVNEVERQRGVLQGFARHGAPSRHYTSSSRTAARAFISRLNHVSNDAIDVFEGIDGRSGQPDGIVTTVFCVFEALLRNIDIAKLLGGELARQAEALANDRQTFDRTAANSLFNSTTLSHVSQIMRSQVELTIYRPELLSDGKGLENAREQQHEDRLRTLKNNLTSALFEVANFIANPGGWNNNIATLCSHALIAIGQWEAFIDRIVSVEVREREERETQCGFTGVTTTTTVRNWGPRRSMNRTLGSYLTSGVVSDIAATKSVLSAWETAFNTTMSRASSFTSAINSNTHVANLDTRTETAIYPPTSFQALQTFANQAKTSLESQATTYSNIANIIRANMAGPTVTAYARALDRGADYFRAIAQTVEIDFAQGAGGEGREGLGSQMLDSLFGGFSIRRTLTPSAKDGIGAVSDALTAYGGSVVGQTADRIARGIRDRNASIGNNERLSRVNNRARNRANRQVGGQAGRASRVGNALKKAGDYLGVGAAVWNGVTDIRRRRANGECVPGAVVGGTVTAAVGWGAAKKGATTGAAFGAKVGTVLIPIPGVGTAVGAVVGGLVGGIIGSEVGKRIGQAAGDLLSAGTSFVSNGIGRIGGAIGGLFRR